MGHEQAVRVTRFLRTVSPPTLSLQNIFVTVTTLGKIIRVSVCSVYNSHKYIVWNEKVTGVCREKQENVKLNTLTSAAAVEAEAAEQRRDDDSVIKINNTKTTAVYV